MSRPQPGAIPPVTEPIPVAPGPGRRAGRLALQAIGFVGAIVLLGWCVREALSPGSREQIARLQEAGPWAFVSLLALSLGTLAVNGLVFWAALLPVRRLRVADVVAVNALATFLNYLPFKAGLVARLVIHRRRDRVPLTILGAWIVATVASLPVALGPLLLVALWRQGAGTRGGEPAALDLGPVALGAALVGAACCAAGVVVVSRALAGPVGLARVRAAAGATRLRPLASLTRRPWFERLHAGMDMLAHPWTFGGCVALRAADVGLNAWRFVLAAGVLGMDIPWAGAVVLACVFYAVGALSPVGMLGVREGATTGLAGLLALAGDQSFAAVALLVGGADALANLVGAALAVPWLRVDRLLRGHAGEPESDGGRGAGPP